MHASEFDFSAAGSRGRVAQAMTDHGGLLFALTFIAWMLFYSYCLIFVFSGNSPIIFTMAKDILFYLFFVAVVSLFCLRGFKVRSSSVTAAVHWILPLVIVALVYSGIDLVRSGSLADTLHSLRDLMMPMLILLVGITISSKHNFPYRSFLRWVAVFSVPVLIAGIYEHFFFNLDDLVRLGLVNEIRAPYIFLQNDTNGKMYGLRAFGFFAAPPELALFCVMILLNSLCARRFCKAPERWMHSAVIALACAALYYTYARTVLISLLLAGLFSVRFSNLKTILVAVAVAVAPVFLLAKLTIAGSGLDPSAFAHLLAYSKVFDYLKVQPWGYGISFSGARPTQVPLDGDYVNWILNIGPIGFLLFLRVYSKLYVANKAKVNGDSRIDTCGQAVKRGIICLTTIMVFQDVYVTAIAWIFHLWLGVLSGVFLSSRLASAKLPLVIGRQVVLVKSIRHEIEAHD